MDYDLAAHQLACRLPAVDGDLTEKPGFVVHGKPRDFDISLQPGHNVAIGPNRTPLLVTEETIRESVIAPERKATTQRSVVGLLSLGSVRCQSKHP